jgi:putative nucleotidyltransferase with HDIG domain
MEEDVPEEAFILHLADRIDVLTTPNDISLNSMERVAEQIMVLSDELFAPWAVEAFMNIKDREDLWFDLDYLSSADILNKINRQELKIGNGTDEMEKLAYTISRVIDYKCPFTASHSVGVARVAELLAEYFDIDKKRAQQIKLAAYLHDIGKIAVPSELLYKQDSLTKKEYNIIKAHPYYTREILKGIKGLEDVVRWASSHHERIDGSGYPSKPDPQSMSIEIEILTYADIFTALTEQRPYRDSLPLEDVLQIMENEFVDVIGSHVFPILKKHGQEIRQELMKIQQTSFNNYPKSNK